MRNFTITVRSETASVVRPHVGDLRDALEAAVTTALRLGLTDGADRVTWSVRDRWGGVASGVLTLSGSSL